MAGSTKQNYHLSIIFGNKSGIVSNSNWACSLWVCFKSTVNIPITYTGTKYGRVLEMPQKVCGGDILHVMAFA